MNKSRYPEEQIALALSPNACRVGRITARRNGVVHRFVSRTADYVLRDRQSEHARPRPPLGRSKAVSGGLGVSPTAARAGGLNSRTCRAGRYVYVGLSIASGYRYAPTI